MTERVLFPDTNTLLHYPPLEQVDWCQLCGASQVQLVICLQVIHELDQKKDDARLADRARRAIKEIRESHARGGTLRDGVTLTVFNQEIRQDDLRESLSPDSKDDRIVHQVIQYHQQHESASIAVVTEDYGMELRCNAHSIPVFRPDPADRLANPSDALQKKYRAAIAENRELKSQRPDLAIGLSADGEDHDPERLLSVTISRTADLLDPEVEVESHQEAHPLMGETFGEAFGHGSLGFPVVTKSQRERYNEELEAHYEKYRVYVCHLNDWRKQMTTAFEFVVWMSNAGSVPADEVDLSIHFPPRFALIAEAESDAAEILWPPAPPAPPKKPEPRSFVDMGIGRAIDQYLNAGPIGIERMIRDANTPVTTVEVQSGPDDSFRIEATVPRIKHHHRQRLGRFIAQFRSWDQVGPFEAPYDITIANHPDVNEGTIVFKVEEG